jgi:hypothetical protein
LRPGGAGVRRSISRFSGDAGLRLGRFAMAVKPRGVRTPRL